VSFIVESALSGKQRGSKLFHSKFLLDCLILASFVTPIFFVLVRNFGVTVFPAASFFFPLDSLPSNIGTAAAAGRREKTRLRFLTLSLCSTAA